MSKPYSFDKHINRENTASVKYDLRETIFGTTEVLPMWVADMDFETPDFIRDAVLKRAKHPIYGYTYRDEAYYEAIINWLKRRHQWQIEKDWIVFSPGIVPALNLCVLALTNEGDGIIVQPPVYFPFFGAVTAHNRNLIYNQLVKGENSYTINFEELEEQAAHASLLLLCNPHNPIGRAWTIEELGRIGEIAIKNNLMVLSDEIHADLVLPGHQHQVFSKLSDDIAALTITAHAPSKTFNLAGMATSSLIIPNADLREKVKGLYDKLHVGHGNIFGAVASTAAFNHGDQWLDDMLEYVDRNVAYVCNYVSEKLMGIKAYRPEATYMIWLDFSALGISDEQLKQSMIHEAGLGLNAGIDFGPGGEACMRINVACPHTLVVKAMEAMHKVFSGKQFDR